MRWIELAADKEHDGNLEVHEVYYAGAPSVITSLWSVGDEATAFLMTAFYRHLLAGATTAEALQKAQLETVDSDEWRSPYYWAAFNLTGDYIGADR